MIILYALFTVFILVTVIVPFYLIWAVVGLINPRTRQQVLTANKVLAAFGSFLLRLAFKLVIAFAITLVWIQFLKWIIIDMLVPHFPP